MGSVAGLVEEEGGHVGREDGRVDHQEQDHPVPQRLDNIFSYNYYIHIYFFSNMNYYQPPLFVFFSFR